MKVGRNDPCPCGSGKKHKNCCLGKGETAAASAPPTGSAAAALDWLHRFHRPALTAAVDHFFDGFEDEELDRIRLLPRGLIEMVEINSTEWLVAEGEIEVRGQTMRVADLVLGPGGPLLRAEDRRWIEGLATHPLRLYEVKDVLPGEGVELRALHPAGKETIFVRERTASRSLVRWDVFGARLVPVADGWVMSGAIYPLDRLQLPTLVTRRRKDRDLPESSLIIEAWLERLIEKRELPKLVDAGTQEPILFVTDHYRVRDWPALEKALRREKDVEGNREESWVWLEPGRKGEPRRVRVALNVGAGDRLELFARTLARADEGKAWFAQIAGDAVAFRSREISDPWAVAEHGDARPRKAQASSEVPMPTELVQQILEDFYRDWADEPIPALRDKTPREAIKTPAGKKKVVSLLKLYEQGEARKAREESREPASFQFLWDELGLPPAR